MTKWGYGLLVLFVFLGVSSVGWRKAGRLAVLFSLIALAYAFHSYHAL